jgi:Bacterial transglutaminase-like cysteine proteinase BTLCP
LRGSGGDFRRRNIILTEQRWTELTTVNREVNRDIIPQRNLGGILTEKWLVSPRSGDCHDYAVTKRHDLLARDPNEVMNSDAVIRGLVLDVDDLRKFDFLRICYAW